MNCRTAEERFCTVTPWRCTSAGRLRERGLHAVVDVDRVDVGVGAEREGDGQAVAAVVAARSTSCRASGRRRRPGLRAAARRSLRPPRPRRPDSVAVTWTCGGTMSGNCATGMRSSASAPAIVMMIAMTIASRGRSTKTAEIMRARQVRGAWAAHRSAAASAGAGFDARCRGGRAARRRPRSSRPPSGRRRSRRSSGVLWPSWTPALLGLVAVAHHLDVVALLVGQDGGARDRRAPRWLRRLRAGR